MGTYSLFVYGSLREPALRRSLLGRDVNVEPAWLRGYAAYYLKNQPYPALRRLTSEVTPGLLITGLDRHDMRRLDAYEGELYWRRPLKVSHGYRCSWAWVYLLRRGHGRQLSRRAYR